MKAFEEWFNKIVCDPSEQCDPTDKAVGCDVCERFREQGWRAALEWVRLQCCPEAWDVGDIEFDIEQELKENA